MICRLKFLFSLLFMMCISAAVAAAPTVQSTADPNADNIWIRPSLKIVNNDTAAMNMAQYTAEYYFYEQDLSLNALVASVWHYGLGAASDVRVTFAAVDPAYTGGEKKAGLVAKITFLRGTLAAGNSVEVKLGIRQQTWQNFNQQDDWSYMAGTAFLDNENIVLRDASGDVVFGEEPADDTVPRPYSTPIYWLGAHTTAEMDEITINQGDAYRNTDDGKAYVYYQDGWMILDDNTLSGGEMPDSNSHLNMNGSNVVNAGTVQTGTLSVTGTVQAGSFTGDGSGLTNIQLQDGAVLFNHLNQSTLDALTAYIAARIQVPRAIVSVITDAASDRFEFRRMGQTTGELLVSYTIARADGTTYQGTVVFPDGADMVSISGFPGNRLTIDYNPIVYELDPLHTTASLPVIEVGIAPYIVGTENYISFTFSSATDVEIPLVYRITSLDGTQREVTIPIPAGWTGGTTSMGVQYGDTVELLPSLLFNILPGQNLVEFPVIEVGIEPYIVGTENYISFTFSSAAPVEIPLVYRITSLDGTQREETIPIPAGWTGGTTSMGVQYGDTVELLPSLLFNILPGQNLVEFPVIEVGIEPYIVGTENYISFTFSSAASVEIPLVYRITSLDGTQREVTIPIPAGWNGGTTSMGIQSGDFVVLLPSMYYEIDPSAGTVQF